MGKAFKNADVDIDGVALTVSRLEAMKPEEASYKVSAKTDYAVYVEFGTKFMQAQPYMRPAVNQTMREADVYANRADSVDEFVELLAEAIADKARTRAPVDTGKLKNSIEAEKLC